jgi:uncharacterized protein YlxW (UPF0749 family)
MQPGQVTSPEKSRKWPARIFIGVGVIAALLIGVAIGNAANSKQGQISSLNGTISQQRGQIGTLQGKVGTLQGQVSTLQSQLSDETNTASHALAVATAKVQAADAAKQARLNQEAATLRARQAQLNQEIGMVQANQISNDGVYVVGKDIKSGTWHTNGGSQCYYATLGSTDTSNILDNNNFNGPDTVNVSGAFAFEINGGCTWVLVG